MVTTVSPSVQAYYEPEKRKRHMLEKSKVTHLTRQLQLRLQYAKLKVDHGWQRQNLNEVENLYFHHSHMRMPKLQLTQPPVLVVNAAAAAKSHDAEPKGAQPDEIRATAPPSLNHHPLNATADLPPPTQQHRESAALMLPTAPTTIDNACNPSSPPSHQQQSEGYTNLLQALSNTSRKPIQSTTKSPLQPRTSSVSSFTPNTPKTPNKSTTSPNPFPSSASSSTALTYDSFWSNHNSSRPFRSSFLSVLGSTDPEVNKVTAQALLSGLSGKDITSYLTKSSDFMTSRPPDATSTLTPIAQRNLPTITEASESG